MCAQKWIYITPVPSRIVFILLFFAFFWQLVYSRHERNEKYTEIISQFHFSCSPFFFFISTRNCLFMTIKIVSHFVYLFFILCRPWKTELGIVRKWSIKKNKFFQKVWRKKKSFFFLPSINNGSSRSQLAYWLDFMKGNPQNDSPHE